MNSWFNYKDFIDLKDRIIIDSDINELLKNNNNNINENNNNINDTKTTNITNNVCQNPKVLVLSGGSVKGIAHIGVITALDRLGKLKNIDTFAGTSIGSLICALVVLGYDSHELHQFIMRFQLELLKNLKFENLLDKLGLDDGRKMEYVLKILIKQKTNDADITLGKLYEKTKKRLIIATTCLTDDNICYLDYENEPYMPLHLALRMSMCIPYMYVPITYKNKMYVDGACIDNYPIGLFKDRLHEVIGVYLRQPKCETSEINNIEQFTYRLLLCITNFTERMSENYKDNTIYIDIKDISTFDFDLSLNKKKQMFESGYYATIHKFTYEL